MIGGNESNVTGPNVIIIRCRKRSRKSFAAGHCRKEASPGREDKDRTRWERGGAEDINTNDAPTAITRLLDLGVQPFLINAVLLGVVAQRLMRKVCPHCIEQYALSMDEVIRVTGSGA